MLAIRMQRTGRKGHAMFRVVVQDSRRTPTSGKVVAQIGSYDPHSKTVTLKKDRASFYLEHGAQPSERVVKLFVSEGVTLPAWVKQPATDKQRKIRNQDKLRKKQPGEASAPEETAESAEPVEPAQVKAADTDQPATETAPAETTEPAETTPEEPAEAAKPEEPAESAEEKAENPET